MSKIGFEDKVATRSSNLPAKNTVSADDLNEIKGSVNSLYEKSVFVVDLSTEYSIIINAPFAFTIESEGFPVGTPTVTYEVNGNPYTFGDLIPAGSELSVTADEYCLVNLVVTYTESNPVVYFKNSGGSSGVNIYNSDGSLSGNRTINLATNKLRFHNGKLIFGTDLTLPYLASFNGMSEGLSGAFFISSGGAAVNAYDATGGAVTATTVSGSALLASSRGSGLAGSFKGAVQVQPHGSSIMNEASAIFQIDATDKGVLFPRQSTTDISGIVSPATGLLVWNTTRNRFEHYTGSYFAGLSMRFLPIQHTSWSPVDGQTVAFGALPFIPVKASITPAPFEIIMRGNGVIRGCDFESYASGVAGNSNAWSLYVRHNGTDYLVQTVSASTASRKFSNQSLNIPYVDGDIVRMVLVNPSWPTNNPSNVAGAGSLKLQ